MSMLKRLLPRRCAARIAAAACFAAAAIAMPAQADQAPVALGTLGAVGQTLGYSASALYGEFRQTLSFELATDLALKGDFLWRNRAATSITGFDATLYSGEGALLASDSDGGATSSLFNPYLTHLAPGAYALVVSGVGGGTSGGQYTLTLAALAPTLATTAVASVPEPATWMTLCAGLLLIGARVRRSTRRATRVA
jgi:hypothetical protein